MFSIESVVILAPIVTAVLLIIYVCNRERWRRHDWTIVNGFGPGQFKTPYPMTVNGAARYAATVGWSVVHVDHARKVLLVKKRA